MLIMLLPNARILYGVDGLGGKAPAPGGFEGDSDMHNWEIGVRKVMAMDRDTLIFGHGPGFGEKGCCGDAHHLSRRCQGNRQDDGGAGPMHALHDVVAKPVAIPPRYKDFTTQVNWDAAINRYCVFWNQGY